MNYTHENTKLKAYFLWLDAGKPDKNFWFEASDNFGPIYIDFLYSECTTDHLLYIFSYLVGREGFLDREDRNYLNKFRPIFHILRERIGWAKNYKIIPLSESIEKVDGVEVKLNEIFTELVVDKLKSLVFKAKWSFLVDGHIVRAA